MFKAASFTRATAENIPIVHQWMMGGWMDDEWMDGWVGGWMDGWVDG